jgi:hypothetical protein
MNDFTQRSIIAILIAHFSGDIKDAGYNCQDLQGNDLLPDDTSFPNVDPSQAKLLAECMESKVGAVWLESHIKVMAADCVAIVLPALSPDRAKQLGIYWQTQQQLIDIQQALAAAGSGN